MTESSFPFATTAPEPDAPVEEARDRKKTLVAAGAGALVVAVLGYFVVLPVFAGSDDEGGVVTTVRKAPTTSVGKAPAAKPAAKKAAPPAPASYNDVSARTDPFKPLVAEPVVKPAAPAPAAPVAPAAPAAPAAPGTTNVGSSTTVQGQRVILLHVYKRDGKAYAQTKVGEKVYSPALGDVFAGTYKLLAVSGKSATYLFGDEQFSLSEGQEVLK